VNNENSKSENFNLFSNFNNNNKISQNKCTIKISHLENDNNLKNLDNSSNAFSNIKQNPAISIKDGTNFSSRKYSLKDFSYFRMLLNEIFCGLCFSNEKKTYFKEKRKEIREKQSLNSLGRIMNYFNK